MTEVGEKFNDSGSTARFFYCAKPSKKKNLKLYLIKNKKQLQGNIMLNGSGFSGTLISKQSPLLNQ